MNIIIDTEVKAFMNRKKCSTLVVEVAETTCSDLDVQEIYIRLCNKKFADYLIHKKHYHSTPVDDILVLLPNYRLEYADSIRFFLKKRWIFTSVGYEGIHF